MYYSDNSSEKGEWAAGEMLGMTVESLKKSLTQSQSRLKIKVENDKLIDSYVMV